MLVGEDCSITAIASISTVHAKEFQLGFQFSGHCRINIFFDVILLLSSTKHQSQISESCKNTDLISKFTEGKECPSMCTNIEKKNE